MYLTSLLRKIESKDSSHRRRTILDEITRLGLIPIVDRYSIDGFKGDDIMVTLPGKIIKKIMLVAHSDTFPGSPGANDSASGCAVLLDILRRLKGRDLNYAIKFVFFDQEEKVHGGGTKGSQAYNRKFETDNVIAIYNPTLVGMGDSVVTWSVDEKTKNGTALAALRKSCKSLGIHLEELKYFKELESDYRVFREEGNNNALALAAVPSKELALLKQYINYPRWSYGKYKLGLIKFPTLFKHYHNNADRSEFLSEKSLQMSSEILYRSLLLLDKI